ncbi:FCD domain-containing protein [Cellulosimicrobium sp. BIT-GX5]|uniref:FCD domain-containing protein n=1 Tax=Cellulosimicrobium composti TaxID=2672572 RepID=A0A6N7ZEW0_9MICO|nr:FCD domain-containing protein [Cellulosimicrobium composti]MTG87984.1 FCD domain-containing protein [Cellulosimicrobium composti]TWG78834.1 GntR family transcriptional regulator [Cellulosimicrobium cellulans J34]SMF51918.1 transcriptional regulator, GntR family [Cellulosimicrobium cellulans J1]
MATTVLHTTVLDTLGRRITSGDAPAGTPLTLESIGTEFGVSRTVAREVMRLLEGLGLVRSKRRVGIVVLGIEDWNVLDPRVIRWRLEGPGRDAQLRTLTELRHAVEPLAAAGAARHATDAERAELVAAAARMRLLGEAGDLEEFLRLDVRFHEILLRASGNEMFGALAGVVAAVLSGRTHLGLMPASPVPEALDQHEAVARAVADADAEAAEAAMAAIVGEVRSALGGVERSS